MAGAGHASPAAAGGPAGDAGPPTDGLTLPSLDARYEAVLGYSPTAILTLDRNGIVVEASKAATDLMALTPKELVGLPLAKFIGEEADKLISRALAGEIVDYEGIGWPSTPGGETWLRAKWVPIRGPNEELQGGVVLIHDATPEKRAMELADRFAFFDPITELPNRAMLTTMLHRALAGTGAERRELALVWLNLDRFKVVNDALGQPVGDRLLRSVAERLQGAIRTNDILSRFGGDDFILLLSRVRTQRQLDSLAKRLHRVFEEPFTVASETVYLTASCGVAIHPKSGSDARELQENAHTAMCVVKTRGGDGFHLYEGGPSEDGMDRLRLAGEMREGFANNSFLLHYQPQIDLGSMRTVGLEALVRWQHPKRGLVPPMQFIPFAEECGLIEPLGLHVLHMGCSRMHDWHSLNGLHPRLAVNVSAREFQRADVCERIRKVAIDTGLAPEYLEIEITESAVLSDPEHAGSIARRLRDTGVSIALDDFGTGYSSLTHLRGLPIDRVKIDRSFVFDCVHDPSAAAIVESVTSLAHRLGLGVVAEGVETEAELEFVRNAGCDLVQGYHFSAPLPPDDCEEHLRGGGVWRGGGAKAPVT